jgi:hypothetical protein
MRLVDDPAGEVGEVCASAGVASKASSKRINAKGARASAIALQAPREREESTPPDDHLQLHRLADWHHSGDPSDRDGEAEEAEHQAGRGAEHRQRAGVLAATCRKL